MSVCNYKLISGIYFVPSLGTSLCVSLYALLLWTGIFMGKKVIFPSLQLYRLVSVGKVS